MRAKDDLLQRLRGSNQHIEKPARFTKIRNVCVRRFGCAAPKRAKVVIHHKVIHLIDLY